MKFYPYHSGNLPSKIYEKATAQILNKIFKFCDMKKIIKPLVKNYQETSKNNLKIDYQNLVQIYSLEKKANKFHMQEFLLEEKIVWIIVI